MKITNLYNLPEPLVSVVENDPYTTEVDWDISTTTLLSPPRIAQLKKRNDNELVEDVSENIYRLIGTNTHHILERVTTKHCIKEKRFSAYVNGWKVSGQIDLFELKSGILSDWKITSVWSVIHGIKPEHEAQLNINAYLMSKGKDPFLKVEKLQVVNLIRDWSKHQIKKSSNYPQCQVSVQDVPMWPVEQAKEYVYHRVKMHQRAVETPSNELPECTPEERWERPTKYAVMKKGRKSALRVLDSHEDAEKYIEDNSLDKNHSIDIREGESVRCESYCNVNFACNQYRKMKTISEMPF
jgi:hypothetical protein